MSEVQSRPTGSRGRGSFRGGRGGFRGGRGGSKPHKSEDQENVPPSSVSEQGEIGELKKQYGSKVSTLRELFPDWSDEDLVYALKETEGDLESAIDRMSSGQYLSRSVGVYILTITRQHISVAGKQEEAAQAQGSSLIYRRDVKCHSRRTWPWWSRGAWSWARNRAWARRSWRPCWYTSKWHAIYGHSSKDDQ
jgi:hypothetical protein